MVSQHTYVIEGKEFNVWTETQLLSINREALKKRCLDLRDHVGQDRLPPMPRQPEAMVAWMLDVQRMAMGANQPAVYQADDAYGYDQDPPYHDSGDRGPPGGQAYFASDHDLPVRGYGEAPPYTPSNAGSIAESRVGALGSKTFVIQGREYNVWTERQLSAMNRESLKNRCLDFRDLIGSDNLRPMPRHAEGMVQWLLHAQEVVMHGGDNNAASYEDEMAVYARGPPGHMRGGPPEDLSRGGPANNYTRDYEPSEAPSEAQSNYEANMAQAAAIRKKNQGSIGLW